MNALDSTVALLLNEYVQRSWTVDTVMVFVNTNNLVKGYLIIPMLWWAWFESNSRRETNREVVLTTLAACLFAVAISQIAQYAPVRLRPLDTPELNLKMAYGLDPQSLSGWSSSFPSDHATLFFSLAVGLLFISRSLGWLALIHATFVISVPRLFLGFHFVTDIVAGAILGGGVTYILCRNHPFRRFLRSFALAWEQRFPAAFYASLFALTALMTHLFYDAHGAAMFLLDILKAIFHRY